MDSINNWIDQLGQLKLDPDEWANADLWLKEQTLGTIAQIASQLETVALEKMWKLYEPQGG